ncbi:alpha/beta fold hydrolase [Nocardia seriolae]|uniref:Dihydrolipoyllysine-residue acetyltransferase n=1 Tax=Nocardia seriolae TaxID=37332 RepID=A0A0B8N817_9NOCA|nr:alpha/beta fold hydrolase [Nocardia seriolae]APA95105.1 Dihydrolipoyllysine-residue acetyltransferase [Nocardia seriolae]MTJ66794.1 alpha/beta fold hydrolase [Nocardia seriolae]MTJ70407.1 alpha/beta fold hydrolase [Nocardia seriolae]MTJ85370.1 alpha/beta fold hydrolase [Nocardia seriolae]MTK29366.1 alpha/beta fold hydrolase [Nocardia seriolae]
MVEGVEVPEAVHRSGDGEPLLLLHGVLLTWQSWGAVLDDLAAEHSVLAPTLPGHWGGPEAVRPATVAALVDHCERLLDESGWETAHIAGNSLGGWIALELAARGRARSCTAIAPAGLWRTPAAADSLLRKFRAFGPLIGLGPGQRPTMPSLLRSLLLPLLANRPADVPNPLAKAMTAAITECAIVDDLAEDPELPTGFTRLAELDLPTTILLPENDRVLPPHVYLPLTSTPSVDVRRLPDLGHVPMLEAPDLITAEIHAAIARTIAPARPA